MKHNRENHKRYFTFFIFCVCIICALGICENQIKANAAVVNEKNKAKCQRRIEKHPGRSSSDNWWIHI